MSKIALSPNASGTGVFTIASPSGNTDRTLTLPDEAGTVLTTASDIDASSVSVKLPSGVTFNNANDADSAGGHTAYFEAGDVNNAPGGVFYKFFTAANGAWATFFEVPAGTGEWAGIIEVTALAKSDVNRHRYQLVRHAYNDAFTALIDSGQNLSISFQLSGQNMQVKADGGTSDLNFCVRVMGSREDN